MSVFDNVRCKYSLPNSQAQGLDFQTKCTPALFTDNYEITAEGRLFHEAYDTKWIDDPSAPFGFYMHGENLRWEPVNFRGQLEIHACHDRRWYSYLFWFKAGRVVDLQHGPGHGEPIPRLVTAERDER